jgi:hypothetical protein
MIVSLTETEFTILIRPEAMMGMLSRARQADTRVGDVIQFQQFPTDDGYLCLIMDSSVRIPLRSAGPRHQVDEEFLATITVSGVVDQPLIRWPSEAAPAGAAASGG